MNSSFIKCSKQIKTLEQMKKLTLTALGGSFTTSFPFCASIASVHAAIAWVRIDIP
jgi:hypothetical protein